LSRIFITGIGAISSIGNTAGENHTSLVNGKCGISNLNRLPSRYSGKLPFGQIFTETETLKDKLHVTEAGVTRSSLLALSACKEAILDAQLTLPELTSPSTALIGATTVGGMCLMNELYRDAHETHTNSPYLSSYDCASVFIFLRNHFKMNGIVNTINTACSSSANAIMFGARLIRNGFARKAIVGGTDSLSKFTINGFHALHLLSTDICAPFDENRKGLNLGEGAAFLILEREEDIGNKNVYAEITGFCNTNDAFHPSSLSEEGEGPYLAMKGALEAANISGVEIDFINAHGTGTENNDLAESNAMIRLFGHTPAFSSTKSNIGHTLGAAGAIEAVFSIFSLLYQEVYPNLHFKEPIITTGLVPVKSFGKNHLKRIMSNSFGFGGNCTSLIFVKP
jgi:3-oxoacyl-(acyl-carrier-protein) synthase